ncbi:MAG: hypothetical protein ACKOX3_10005 [Bacteroidota bacterium]
MILLSSVKFVTGPTFAYYNQSYEFTFFEVILYSVTGGMLGVIVFTFFSDKIHQLWIHFKNKLKKTFTNDQNYSEPKADVDTPIKIKYEYVNHHQESKKVFTKRNRRLVTIFKKYGLFGIAFLTPVLLSIPIGTIVANSFENKKRKIFLYMFISILFWSTLMVSLFEIFHAKNVIDLQEQIIK